jgi:hypothetical protein
LVVATYSGVEPGWNPATGRVLSLASRIVHDLVN